MTEERKYRDLREHIKLLDEKGLLITIDEPINKDSEMHPLVRWQFRGGIAEKNRKAFLFNNIVNAKGKRYGTPVVVCALAASQEVYSAGMNAPVEAMGEKWNEIFTSRRPCVTYSQCPAAEKTFCVSTYSMLVLSLSR